MTLRLSTTLVAAGLLAFAGLTHAAGEISVIGATYNPESYGVRWLNGNVRVYHQNDGGSNRQHKVFMVSHKSDGSEYTMQAELVQGLDAGAATYRFYGSYCGWFGTPCLQDFYLRYDYTRVINGQTLTTSFIDNNNGNNFHVVDQASSEFNHLDGGWKRTIVFIYGVTQPGQDMFIRGGIDHGYANSMLGRNCTSSNYRCSIPIHHNNLRNKTTAPWKAKDFYLDWYGTENGQSGSAPGSALDWTTNLWPTAWGPARTYYMDGSGQMSLNTWGHHYWALDVMMDCSKTVNNTFELKSYISNGPGWETLNAPQAGAPYVGLVANHFAQCGKVNKFERGSNAVFVTDVPSYVY